MTFDDIKGNEKVFAGLKKAAMSGNAAHAYIIEGDASVHKDIVAKVFAKAILCTEKRGTGCGMCSVCNKIEHENHEDIFYVRKEGNSIKDEDMSNLQERLKNKPLGERNIAIVEDADTMTLRAQNRILKTLEEPPAGTVIMLLSENTENLIRTIVSRCAVIRLSHAEEIEDAESMKLAADTADALIAGKSFYEIKRILGDVTENKDKAFAFLDAFEHFYGNAAVRGGRQEMLYQKEYIYSQVENIEEARRDLRRNVSVGYVIKCLMLKSMS